MVSIAVIEVVPESASVTCGRGVSLAKLQDPDTARARVPVS